MVKNLPTNAGGIRDANPIPGLGRSPRRGNGNPLQYFCLENSMDREAWRAIVHGVAKSRIRRKRLSIHACTQSYVINLVEGSHSQELLIFGYRAQDNLGVKVWSYFSKDFQMLSKQVLFDPDKCELKTLRWCFRGALKSSGTIIPYISAQKEFSERQSDR